MKDYKPELKEHDIGDAKIQYLYYDGDGPPLVMLHATGFLPWTWHPIARELRENFRVFAPYFCDHRSAEPEEGGLGWMVLADDLFRFMSGLDLDSPLMVGHSMGATVAAMGEAAFGPRAKKMILIEPIFLPSPFYKLDITVDQHPLAGKSIKRRNGWSGRKEALDYLRGKPLFSNWNDEMLEIYVERGMVESDGGGLELSCHPRREAALFMGGREQDPWPLLNEVSCPALILEGETSENRKFIDLKKAAETMKCCEYRLVPGVGHLMPMEDPGSIAGIIAEFFAG